MVISLGPNAWNAYQSKRTLHPKERKGNNKCLKPEKGTCKLKKKENKGFGMQKGPRKG
jgi:hypothetical protein